MIMQRLIQARKRNQGGFTLVELLVVIAILGILAAIVLFNISGVQNTAACNSMKTDGATIQSAADLYYNSKGVYPDAAAGGDTATPANGDGVAVTKLLLNNLLHQAPPATEAFVYEGNPPTTSYGNGTIKGNLVPASAACVYNGP
jgi:prepilin-type N-terminal cleavage/methylation domain-containing protein